MGGEVPVFLRRKKEKGDRKKNRHRRGLAKKYEQAMDPTDEPPNPTGEPSDPDGAMYEALRARPAWIDKPSAKAALEELARDVPAGEDLFYWPMGKPGEVKPSDASEQASAIVTAAPPGTLGLESRRVYVAAEADPRRLATERRPGRNGPSERPAPSRDTTLVSFRGGGSPGGSRGEEARATKGRALRIARIGVAVIGVIAVGVGVARMLAGDARTEAASATASAVRSDEAAAQAAIAMAPARARPGAGDPEPGPGRTPATAAPHATSAAAVPSLAGTTGPSVTAAAGSGAMSAPRPASPAMAPASSGTARGVGAASARWPVLVATGGASEPSVRPTGDTPAAPVTIRLPEVDTAPASSSASVAPPPVPPPVTAPIRRAPSAPEQRPDF